MTAYRADLATGQQLYLENQGSQTLITLSSSNPGQQQSQQSGFPTGSWTAEPTLLRTSQGMIVRLQSAQGQWFVQVQANGMQMLNAAPELANAEAIPLQSTTAPTTAAMPKLEPMQPMQPMQPMKMGNMEMQMNPMQMRMGDMQMSMDDRASSAPAPRRFCTQCGSAIAPDDKFCAHCGHQLSKP